MQIIYLSTTDPEFNLAAEEYFLNTSKTDICILWQNEDSIIVGRNQNTLSEINIEKVKELNIKVVRRMSGGGAVFHDLGNLNYTFISQNNPQDYLNFAKFTKPIIEVLNKMGVSAQLSGRNDLLIDDKKFSGNAQYISKDKLLHHGTLLFSSNIDKLTDLLKCNPEKIRSKGISSIKNRVTNISSHLSESMSVLELKDRIIDHVLSSNSAVLRAVLPEDLTAIIKLKNEKYSTWEWNYGYSPKYTFHKINYFPSGGIEINLEIKSGIIEKANIFGDFFSLYGLLDFENLLIGLKHNEENISNFLDSINFNNYFAGITKQQLLDCFF
ncbi:MAG: lplJ [Clostridia bacterium]|nr:lplJ [Clostridia bacterium]